MDNHARDAYLETQLLTATPQKMRLMLIEGAIRFGRQTLRLWDEQLDEQAYESLVRCREIIGELLSSIRTDDSLLAKQVAAIYIFLFRELTEAQHRRDRQKINDVLSVLDEERLTWQTLCIEHAEAPEQLEQYQRPLEITAASCPPSAAMSAPQRFSFEA